MDLRASALPCWLIVVALLAGCGATPNDAQPAAPVVVASSPSPTAVSGACQWLPVPAGAEANLKDVGTPPPVARTTGTATLTITTNLGVIEVQMYPRVTPCAVASFAYLAGKKFFDGTSCHRLIVEMLFVLGCGDPSGTGKGGPTYQYAEESLGTKPGYQRGVVAVGLRGPNEEPGTSGSQFFINYADNQQLVASYTTLGTITKGLEIVDKVAAGGVKSGGASAQEGSPKIGLTLQRVAVAYS